MWECAAVRDERSCVLLTSLTGTVVILAVANEWAQCYLAVNEAMCGKSALLVRSAAGVCRGREVGR